VFAFGLYKIFICLEAFVHESILFCTNSPLRLGTPTPPVSPTRLRNILVPPVLLLFPYALYNVGNGNIV